MKIKHLLLGLFAVAATVACEELIETPSLDVDKTAVSVGAVDGQASFNVTSNQSWVATADADWVELEPASGDASKEAVAVTVKAKDNDTEEVRNATVTVTAGELTKTVKVTQAAAQSQGPELPASEWALVGAFGEGNNWNAASDLYLSVLDDEYFVYYSIELAETTEFKFLKGGAWPDQGGVELGGSGLVEPNTIQNVGTYNIKVTEAGTFDIYLTADLTKFYVMEVGKLPSEAVEPSPIENEWGMMGCFVDNQWASDVPMTVEGEWIVAKGAQFTELTFKIRANASWIDATNIGVVPGSEKGVVNGKISVATAEYCKANGHGDAADIKLNGAAGTYDVYFSFENLEVYVMEPGFKPGEKEPQNPEPVEVTYTVVGTISGEGNAWSNNAAIGLMTLDGDYYVAKNIPFVWSSTLYPDNSFNGIELKICETGSWTAYCHNQLSPSPANTEIEVVYGVEANIQVEGPEGNYDVYFDKTNSKLWVMNAGLKPGDEAPVVGDFDVDGKQWTFAWQAMGGASCVIDLGVTEPGVAILAYDMGMLDPSYAGIYYPYMMGAYTIAKTDGTSGVVTLTAEGQSVEIPYSKATENTVHFESAALLEENIDCTLATSLIEISTGAAEGLADGEYWIIADGKVATPLTGSFGYLNVVDAVDGKSTAANAFTFTQVDAGVYTIQDSNGKYYYQTGTFNSFNVADEDGMTDDYLWEVYDSGNGQFVIMNLGVGKFMQYDSNYNSYGSYSDERGVLPTLVLADDPIAGAELSEWAMIGSWTEWATDQPMYVEGLYAVAKGVEFDATTEFKFRRNGSWADADVIGAKATVGVDLACPALHPGSNIILGESGTYDVYLDVQNLMFYIMSPGKTPGQALEPSLSSVVVYCAKFSDWDNNYLYTYNPQLQTWPGMLGESVDVNGTTYYKWVLEGVELGSGYNAIFTDNQGNQTVDITGLTFQAEQWFAISTDLVEGKNAAYQTDGPVEVLPDVWGVAGSFNGWDPAATVMDEEGDWYVAKNLALDADGFKFVKNKSWTVNLTADATVTPNVEFAAVNGDGKGNIVVDPTGTYDVYLAKTLDKAYVMTPGYKPGETPAPEPEGPVVVTVAEFLAAAEDDTVYELTGTIKRIVTAYNSQYNNISFLLEDATGEVSIYRMSCVGVADATSLTVGDEITLQGCRSSYNDSPQMAAGGKYVSHVDKEAPAPEAGTYTLSFAEAANRTVLTTSQQVWEQNGVKLTNDKAGSTSNVADYTAPARFYKGTSLKIEKAGMTKIVFNLNNGKPASGLTDSSMTPAAEVVANGYEVTLTFAEATDVFEIAALANQIRVDSIVVYAK